MIHSSYWDLVTLMRLFYLVSAFSIVLVQLIPSLRRRFLAYGARANNAAESNTTQKLLRSGSVLDNLLDTFAGFKVPHSWFFHFYLLSVVSSLVWLNEAARGGAFLDQISFLCNRREHYMSGERATLCITLMLVQGIRRLFECVMFTKPSTSTMWVGHYLIGLAFYLVTNVAVWIEGLRRKRVAMFVYTPETAMLNVKTLICLVIFIAMSALQHDVHSYLSGLRGYQLPQHWAFRVVVTPHYLAECIIYVSLALLAAPEGQVVNWTMVCTCIFVAVNLGVTADGTRKWMTERFNEQRGDVLKKSRMIPGIW